MDGELQAIQLIKGRQVDPQHTPSCQQPDLRDRHEDPLSPAVRGWVGGCRCMGCSSGVHWRIRKVLGLVVLADNGAKGTSVNFCVQQLTLASLVDKVDSLHEWQ